MESSQSIHAFKGYVMGMAQLKDLRPNYYHVYNSTHTRIFFCHSKSKMTLMVRLTFEWDDGMTTTLVLKNTSKYRIRYKDRYVKAFDLEVGSKGRFSHDGKKARLISKDHIVGRACYVYTENSFLEVNRILLMCSPPKILKHTKYTTRISRFLAYPNLCLGMRLFV